MPVPLPVSLDLDGPVVVEPLWSLPLLLAGESMVRGPEGLRVRGGELDGPAEEIGARLEDLLAEVVRPTPVSLLLERNGRSARVEVHLLPPWSHVPGDRPWSLLPLVLPHEDEVASLAARVEAGAEDGGPGEQLHVLFELLADEAIRLEPPRMHHAPVPWQEIAAPWRILGPTRPRRATCIDLALLGAGVLEALGRSPLILLEGGDTGHAWLAVAEGRPGWRPWTREAPTGLAEVVEITAICDGEARASWNDAVRLGRERLASDRPIDVLDVGAGRPPQGRLRPLRAARDAVAAHAVAAARRAGDGRRALRRESLHLLLGLVETRGPLAIELFGEAGLDRLGREIGDLLPDEGSDDPPRPTANWSLGLETADLLARNRGSRVVQEGDLLRSVLQTASPNIRHLLEEAGFDLGDLRRRLERAWPRLREETHLRRPGGGS